MGAASEDLLWYQFKHFDHSEYDDYKYQDSFYNYQGFAKDLGEYSEIFLEGEPLLIIACVLENLGSILAVKGGDSSNDMTVYDFSYDDIERKGNGAGKIDESNTRRAFSSYTELLSRVSAVKLKIIL